MKIERPEFELTRVYADGTKDSPEIIPVSRMPWDTRMERRGFPGVGVGVASVLVLSTSACSSTNKAHDLRVSALAISPDGKTLASGEGEGVVTLWDLENKSSRASLFDPKVRQYEPSAPSNSSGSSGSTGVGSGGGTYCTCNKVCTCIPVPSDRNAKEAFETTDPLLILQRLSELPIQTWNYKWNDAAIRHIRPMAQDFAAAFAVGEDDKHICPVDAQGVALAAIQGLYRIVKEKYAQTESLQEQLRQQQAENQELKARVELLERLMNRF